MCSDALIGARMETIFEDKHGLYGAKRIAASLSDDTDLAPINHEKVARIMKTMGLKGFTKRCRCITTQRELVGHALTDHMRVSLVIEALSLARKVRGSLGGAIFSF